MYRATRATVLAIVAAVVASPVIVIALPTSARAVVPDLTVGTATATKGANSCSWDFGSPALTKSVVFDAGGVFTMKSLTDAAAHNYVASGSVSPEFSVNWGGTALSGSTAGWTCSAGAATASTYGGQPVLKVAITLARTGIQVTQSYTVFPDTPLIQQNTTYKNTAAAAALVTKPSILDNRLMAGEQAQTDVKYIRGAEILEDSWKLQSERMTNSYIRDFNSSDQFGCSGPTSQSWWDMSSYTGVWNSDGGGFVYVDAIHPGPNSGYSAARTWVAPSAGTVDLSGQVYKDDTSFGGGDGVDVRITKNGTVLWSAHIAGMDTVGQAASVANVTVTAGDQIRFEIGNYGDYFYDKTHWNPTVSYLAGASYSASAGFSGTQGSSNWRYESFGDRACPSLGWEETSSSYAPWLSMYNRVQNNGVFIGWDYFGNWNARVNSTDGSLTLSMSNYSSSLAAGANLVGPTAFTGAYRNDLDNMTNALLDWQYKYLWDHTNSTWFGGVRDAGDWYFGSQVSNTWDDQGNRQKAFELADDLRTIGAQTYWRDYGWWDKAGDWNGPDWQEVGDYLAKSGMNKIVYMPAYNAANTAAVVQSNPSWFLPIPGRCSFYSDKLLNLANPAAATYLQNLLISKADQWGSFQWRGDSCMIGDVTGQTQLAQDQAFRAVVANFLDSRTGSSFQAVNSGGRELGYQYLSLASGSTFSDLKGYQHIGGISSIFPVDKLSGEGLAVNECGPQYNAELALSPNFGLTGNAAQNECVRSVIDKYRYLLDRGVAGRWSHQYHPTTSSGGSDWFERVSQDGLRSLMVYLGSGSGTSNTVYPKGLLPASNYTVRTEYGSTSYSATGAALMASGITLTSTATGQLIYLNLSDHPGNTADVTAPATPSSVTATSATNLGFSGVDVTWAAATDNAWVSGYQVLRDGTVIGTVSQGTYFFDHSVRADPGRTYSVRAVDGSGNLSAAQVATSPLTGTAETTTDDAAAGITYTGPWAHRTGSESTYAGTSSVGGPCSTAGQCYKASLGFSGTQGTNSWSYEDKVSGVWTPIDTYTAPYWHDSDGGFVWSDALHPGAAVDTARTWTAPSAGIVTISGKAAKAEGGGNGVTVTVSKNGVAGFGPETIAGSDTVGLAVNTDFSVQAGDKIRFEVGRNGDFAYDKTAWDPLVRYVSASATPAQATVTPASTQFSSTQGSNGWSYQDRTGTTWANIAGYNAAGAFWHDTTGGFVWSGSEHPGPNGDTARTYTVSTSGIVELTGRAAKSDTGGGDGVTVTITVNGRAVYGPQTIAYNDTVGVPTNVTASVKPGDVIRFEIGRRGDFSYDKISWDPGIRYLTTTADTVPSSTYTFTGNSVTVFGQLTQDSGKATFDVDGQATTVDLFTPDKPTLSVPVFSKAWSSTGSHTLTITWTGDMNPLSRGDLVYLDGYSVGQRSLTTTQNTALTYTGTGWSTSSASDDLGGTAAVSATAGNEAQYTFTGRSFQWIGKLCPSCGVADVYIDGIKVGRADTYGARGTTALRSIIFRRSWTTSAAHTVRIAVLGSHNLTSSGSSVFVDAIQTS